MGDEDQCNDSIMGCNKRDGSAIVGRKPWKAQSWESIFVLKPVMIIVKTRTTSLATDPLQGLHIFDAGESGPTNLIDSRCSKYLTYLGIGLLISSKGQEKISCVVF
jgi:hypothetical protein